MPSKIQIQIVTWNSKKYLENLFEGIEKQKGVDFKIIVIDNASSDGTIEWIKKNKPNTEVIQNKENFGFAKAHNQGFANSEAPYVLVLNPDIELCENVLIEMLKIAEIDPKIASVGPVLFQQLPKQGNNGIIDSLGLKMGLFGQIRDIGQNRPWKPNFGLKTDVFGITGACVLYRLSALKQVTEKYGIFDERFGSYKEDADLAWRLKKAGFEAKISETAIAQHERGVKKGNRANIPDMIKFLSIRNHLLMLKKNLCLKDWFRFPFILKYEFAKFIYVALFETQNIKAYKVLFSK